jgi:hypothetical protein
LKSAHKILANKPEEKKALEKLRCGWKYNIKIDLKETVSENVDWIHLAQDSVQWPAPINGNGTWGRIKGGNVVII